jgi:membrane fusion protein, hemolysin D
VGREMNDVELRKALFRLTFGMAAFVAVLAAVGILGEVDIATKAVGRFVPDEQVKVVQALETGYITEIAVREASRVKAGEVLLRLDTTDALADEQRTATDLAVARVEFARLKATIDYEQGVPFSPPEGSPQYAIDFSTHLMRNQISEITSAVAEIDSSIREKEALIVTTRALIKKYAELVPVLQERENMQTRLLGAQATSRLSYLDERETEAALDTLRDRRRNVLLKFRSDRLAEIVEMQRKMLGLEQDYRKAQERLKRHDVLAPIDGTVQDLTIYTIGAVVSQGDSLMTIVPADANLIVEAYVPHTDIGYVETGQDADVRVTTFDYRIYGSVKGKVVNVSRDATRDSYTTIKSLNPGPLSKTLTDRIADVKKVDASLQQGPIFRVQISLEKTTMNIDGHDTQLTSGMTVEANILVGHRRIIDFFLEPFQTYRYEAFRQ